MNWKKPQIGETLYCFNTIKYLGLKKGKKYTVKEVIYPFISKPVFNNLTPQIEDKECDDFATFSDEGYWLKFEEIDQNEIVAQIYFTDISDRPKL